MERAGNHQVIKAKEDAGYVQNEEQNNSTLWQRVQQTKGE